MYLLAIDIGNTTISLGVFSTKGGSALIKNLGSGHGQRFVSNLKIPTGKRAAYNRSVMRCLYQGKVKAEDISKIILCSVVPKETGVLKGILHKLWHKKVLLVGSDISVPIINRYKNPKQVGQDRLVNAYAGLKLYGPGLILVDFGTAVTFDIVSKKSEYLGGLIFPGLDLSLEALNQKTALLPKISIRYPNSLVGRDTTSSINNGTVFGMAGACDGVISRLQKKFKGYKIVTTGGNIGFIKRYSAKIKVIRPNLTLEGLFFLSLS